MANVLCVDRGNGRWHCRVTGLAPAQAKAVRTFLQAAEPEARWEELKDEVESLDSGLTRQQIEILVGQALTPRPLGV